ncbi:Pfs NACHT and Ankyrin domain protein [Penicillium malachiteum]|uniref:Pfs NACHT and Ankyrin domain protein n=1 Tax=Penicillium malachiteum TaxID=1324776 RepID=A0AAD6HXK8_9EURO|nr:Pfs NACHT and Ankyrin domain protein [Penicillium malachiteum]
MVSQNALDNPDSYAIAWIAALPIERAAAEAMLDEEHAAPKDFTRHQTDANVYTWGRVGEHNIVIASLAAEDYGTTSATTTASNLLASLPSIRVGLLVGIGGGIARPNEGVDIRLGDIVISQPSGTTGGVCQYDLIKAKSGDKRERKGFLGRPPTVLLKALASIQANHERKDSKVPCFLQEMLEKNPKMKKRSRQSPGYIHQGFENDRLFKASCDHVPGTDCRGCDTADEVQRDPRDTIDPEIHYGTIASGNTLVKDAATRDRIFADLGEDCICFEMEASGLMNHFPCLVIRGICDYADSHKNDRWQRYASATSAAYAKEFLAYVPATEVQETKRVLEVLQLVQQQIDSMQQTTIATKATTDSIRSNLHTDEIKRWLCPPDPSSNANHARALRYEGTGAWLLESPVFQSWHSGSRQQLWLHGLAGCGKSVLSTTVIDHLAEENNSLILSFFFDFNDVAKQTLDGMLRSLAFQLYHGGVGSAHHLDALFQAHRNGSDQPATKALWGIVFRMLEEKRKLSIILDALDESKTRDDVLEWIKGIVSGPDLDHVQLLLTSRPELEFVRDIPLLIGRESCLPLDTQAVNSDIRSWVSAQLIQRRDFTEKALSQHILEEIQRQVGDGADGMFRWAFCQLDSLARCRHEADLEKALTSLPRNLNETYSRMMDSIPAELKNDSIRLLQFLVHSKRPLKVAEAKEVIATKIENKSEGFNTKRRLFCDNDILAYCPSLVTVVQATDKELHLAHFSVKEYLLGEYQFNITTASICIMKACLTYLTDIDGNEKSIKEKFPMARYAAEIWTNHAAFALASEDIGQMIVRFLTTEETFQRWTRLYQPDMSWKTEPGPARGSKLYYACLEGLFKPARDLVSKGADVNTQGGFFGNALQAASSNGHQEIVNLLLEKGADVNAQGGEYGNALQAASLDGHQEIVNLLLEKGADVNAQGGEYGNALQAASLDGHQEIVNLLLDKGADVNTQGGLYGNALQAASSNGHQGIVNLLLEKGAKVNVQGGKYGNALQAASSSGHREIVKLLLEKGGEYGNALQAASSNGYQEIVNLLLEKGADVNAQSGEYGSALQAASLNGYQEIVNLLLEKGADVNAQGGFFGNALQAASSSGHREIVKLLLEKGGEYGNALQAASSNGYQEIVNLLLEKGADVNTQGGFFGNALQAASSNGYQEIVNLLLEKGADVNAQGSRYGNALQAASSNGHQEIVNLLLEKGADVNTQGGFFGNALQAASSHSYQEIVNLLLEKGANVNTQGGFFGNALQAASSNGHQEIVNLLLEKGGEYGNALQAASSNGYQEIVNLLLEKGADVNAQSGEYGSAIQAASLNGYQEIVNLLLEKGADVNTQGGFFGNALQAASSNGYQEIVNLLLAKGADVNAQGGKYGSALQAVSSNGHQEIVNLLLEKGADVNAQSGEYGSALQAASLNGQQEIVNLLLEKGADVNAQSGEYGSALQAASLNGYQEIVNLLLEKGADVNAQGGFFGNALQAASSNGHQEIVNLLLEKGADVNAQGGEYGDDDDDDYYLLI